MINILLNKLIANSTIHIHPNIIIVSYLIQSEQHKLLAHVAHHLVGSHLQHVEVHCLCQWTALTNQHDVTFFYWKSRGNVSWDISMSLFVSVVFGDVMQVISPDDNSALHLGRDDDSLKNFASNGDSRGEGTFFIDVVWFNCLLWCFEVESNLFVVSDTWRGLFGKQFFGVEEDIVLLLERSFVLP